MTRLEELPVLGRKIRLDNCVDLSVPTWSLVENAIREGKQEEALAFLEYGYLESRNMHDNMVAFTDDALTFIARYGEEEVFNFLRQKFLPRVKDWLSSTPGVFETVQRFAKFQRGHFSEWRKS